MTDEEALKEIDRQEKRFAAAKCGRGLQLAKSAREYYQTIVKCQGWRGSSMYCVKGENEKTLLGSGL